ncbi:APC family permease [Mycolicibacterium baixiangningiae]|uniref:APC family permease n=1 Tax=Mycolicibacterium baixiangningiae TaxID=2761578 RepID=UPI001E5A93F4|nr:APC family permease [Mycolicibacterium baixiangningiae]
MTDMIIPAPAAGTPAASAPSALPGATKLTGNLGVASIVFMVVAAAAPLTVVGGVIPMGFAFGNGLGFPVMFFVSAAILILFSVGMSQMASRIPTPGAFYTYVQHGIGEKSGAATALVAIVTYVAAPVSALTLMGVQLNITVVSLGGPDIAWWIYCLLTIALVGVLGYRHIDLSSKVLGILLVAEVAIVAVLVAVVFATGGAEGYSAEPFTTGAVFSGELGVGLTFALLGFVGFEATAVFRDEARNPGKTIPRATYIAVVSVGLFYAISAYSMVVAWGPDGVVEESLGDPAGMLVATTQNYLGAMGSIVAQVLLLTSIFACILSFHNVTARYFHALGQSGVLPSRLGLTHKRHVSPHMGSLTQTTLCAATILVFAMLSLDPMLQVFAWMGGLTTSGFLILLVLTSLAVLTFFMRKRGKGNVWTTRVAPALGLAGLVLSGALVVLNFPMLVGGSPALAYSLLAVFPVAAVIGVVLAIRRGPIQPTVT